ncbi:MAG: hypothetical protein K2Q10_07545 [Rhodospirillales bacterium]|nr:hypothetical protein [Rhodospirillales bacterium]
MRGSYLSASGAFMLAGVASVPSPVPIGFVLFVVGLYFLARSSRRGRQSVKWLRRQSPTFSRGLNRLKSRLPGRMRKFVESSDPGE